MPRALIASSTALVLACAAPGTIAPTEETSDATPPPAAQPPVQLVDITAASGLAPSGTLTTTCLLFADLDGDGREDAGWIAATATLQLEIAWGRGDGTFDPVDVTPLPGFEAGEGCVIEDFDRDGRFDVAVGAAKGVLVIRQTSSRAFQPSSMALPTGPTEATTALAVVDPDDDGWPDLVLLRSPHVAFPGSQCAWHPDALEVLCDSVEPLSPMAPPELAQNDGGTLVWDPGRVLQKEAATAYRRFAAASIDLDGDGREDVVTTADFGHNLVFRGLADGTFEERDDAVFHKYRHGMSLAFGDVNDDGRPDLWFTDIGPEAFYLSNAAGGFDRDPAWGGVAGLTEGSFAWGTTLADLDVDGDLDVFQQNQFNFDAGADLVQVIDAAPLLMRNPSLKDRLPRALFEPKADYVLTNDGAGRFERSLGPGLDVEFMRCYPSAAAADVDGDGDLDLLESLCDRVRLLRNDRPGSGAWLEVVLHGTSATKSGFGATLAVTAGPRTVRRFVTSGEGQASASSRTVHFGLGDAAPPASLAVTWRAGCVQQVPVSELNRRIDVVETCP